MTQLITTEVYNSCPSANTQNSIILSLLFSFSTYEPVMCVQHKLADNGTICRRSPTDWQF